jgi:hypothetical protein
MTNTGPKTSEQSEEFEQLKPREKEKQAGSFDVWNVKDEFEQGRRREPSDGQVEEIIEDDVTSPISPSP